MDGEDEGLLSHDHEILSSVAKLVPVHWLEKHRSAEGARGLCTNFSIHYI